MTPTKSVLASAIMFLFLAACRPDIPPAVDDQTLIPTVASIIADETASPMPVSTEKPAAEPAIATKESKATSSPEPPRISETEPEKAVTQAGEAEISIKGVEDLPLTATLYTPGLSDPLPGVILLHMLGSNRHVWQETGLVDDLVTNGYVVLALDMRGHGDTGGDPDWNLAPEDLRLVWEYFTALDVVDPQRTAIIGASIGANLALLTGADEPAIQAVILLSPGLDYRGVTTEEPLKRWGERPILIIASEEDTYAANSSRTLADQALGESQLEMYSGAGHGTRMFGAQPELNGLILAWLNQNIN